MIGVRGAERLTAWEENGGHRKEDAGGSPVARLDGREVRRCEGRKLLLRLALLRSAFGAQAAE
jgi:hypothetical protein